jgi:hypothetical protein
VDNTVERVGGGTLIHVKHQVKGYFLVHRVIHGDFGTSTGKSRSTHRDSTSDPQPIHKHDVTS